MGSCVNGQAVPAVLKDHSAFKTAGTIHQVTEHHIPEDLNLHQYCLRTPKVVQINILVTVFPKNISHKALQHEVK
jgi:hypothetical protein